MRYSYRVTLDGPCGPLRLGEFDNSEVAVHLARTLASRFGLTFLDLQEPPPLEVIRENEHLNANVEVRSAN